MRARAAAKVSQFRPRYPFGQDRGPAAKKLLTSDPNSPLGHEPELAHLLDLLLPTDGVFLDVGSNYGYFSAYVATRPGYRGHIHAFEPIPQSFHGLREIIESLHCDDQVTCHQMAVSDQLGTKKMEVGADPGLAKISEDNSENAVSVKTTTLDSLNFGRADFIKIDVEGHEAAVLRGANGLIKRQKPYIFLESWSFPEDPDKVFEALRFLMDHGYELYLPAWLQPDDTFFVGIGPTHDMTYLALVPFTFEDRLTFPGNPINIFAAHKTKAASLGVAWDKRRIIATYGRRRES